MNEYCLASSMLTVFVRSGPEIAFFVTACLTLRRNKRTVARMATRQIERRQAPGWSRPGAGVFRGRNVPARLHPQMARENSVFAHGR